MAKAGIVDKTPIPEPFPQPGERGLVSEMVRKMNFFHQPKIAPDGTPIGRDLSNKVDYPPRLQRGGRLIHAAPLFSLSF